MSHTPVKIPRSGPTRPENILKNVPRPRTGFGPVRSGETRGFGLPRRSLIGGVSKLKKYQQVWKKKWKLKYGIVASTFNFLGFYSLLQGGTQIWFGWGCAARALKPVPTFKSHFGRKRYPSRYFSQKRGSFFTIFGCSQDKYSKILQILRKWDHGYWFLVKNLPITSITSLYMLICKLLPPPHLVLAAVIVKKKSVNFYSEY